MAGPRINAAQPLNPPPMLQILPRPLPPLPPAPPPHVQNMALVLPLARPAAPHGFHPPAPGQPQPAQRRGPVPPPFPDEDGNIGRLLDPDWFKVIIMRCTAGIHQGTSSVTLDRWQGTWTFLPNEFVESAIFASSGLPVTHMILKHHCLSKLPPNFAALATGLCVSLSTLDISHNKFSTLPSTICELVGLTELFLNNNQISQLPAEISNLTKLEYLNLQVNCLQVLPVCLCALTSLKSLNASDNAIEFIPSEICQLKELRELFLKSNQITHLPQSFTELPHLQELHLSNNKLQKIELKGLTSLRQLHLASNNLRFLPPSIVDINLQGLTVSHNPLKFPPLSVCREGLGALKAYILEKYHNGEDQCVWENPYYNSDGDDTDYEAIAQ